MKNSKEFPLYVRVGLFGINSRKSAFGYFWFCIVAAIVSIILGFKDNIFFLGSAFLLSALWYYVCIKWIDKNSKWNE